MSEPYELEELVREEHEADLRLAAARDQARMNEGEAPTEHQELVRKLEADWRRARERLDQARHPKQD